MHCDSEEADVAPTGELPREETTGADVAGEVGASDVPGTTGVVGMTAGVVAGVVGTTAGLETSGVETATGVVASGVVAG